VWQLLLVGVSAADASSQAYVMLLLLLVLRLTAGPVIHCLVAAIACECNTSTANAS
jgi:hypothetical protein